jgi:hypothetical protein
MRCHSATSLLPSLDPPVSKMTLVKSSPTAASRCEPERCKAYKWMSYKASRHLLKFVYKYGNAWICVLPEPLEATSVRQSGSGFRWSMASGTAQRHGNGWGGGQGRLSWWRHRRRLTVDGDEGCRPMDEVAVVAASLAVGYWGQRGDGWGRVTDGRRPQTQVIGRAAVEGRCSVVDVAVASRVAG